MHLCDSLCTIFADLMCVRVHVFVYVCLCVGTYINTCTNILLSGGRRVGAHFESYANAQNSLVVIIHSLCRNNVQ